MDEELKQSIDNELAILNENTLEAQEKDNNNIEMEVKQPEQKIDFDSIEWEDVKQPEQKIDFDSIEWEPVNIPSYTTLDADTNKVYSVPATMDETDTRFAIHTQAEKIGKDNFLGKVLLFGGQLALDYVKGKAKEAVGEAKQAPKSAAAGALDIGASIVRGETDLLFDYFRRKERAEKGKNKGSSSMPRLGLAELFLPDDVVEAGRAADEAAYIADEIKGRAEPRISQEMAENPVSLMYGGEFDRPVSDEEFDAAQKNAQELNQKAVALYEKWRQHNVETINKISLGLMPEEMRGKKDFQNVMYGIGNSATSIAASMAITLATKNPYVASMMISKAYFDSSKSEAFQEALERGEDFDTADLHSDILGAFDGVLEGTGDFIMMGIAKVGTAPASKVLKNAFVGSVEKILNNRAVAAPVKTAVKNVARQSSVFKAAAKGFLTEGPFEETLQNVLGDEYRNAIGWQDKSQADIWADASYAGFVGGITGAGFGAGGTMLYNHRMRNWNRQIKDQVKAYNPGIDDQTAQTTADLLQETFLQEGAPAIDTLDQLLNKEKDPDTMPEGIDARSISEVSRQVMKERFGVTDEQIDQWAKIVAPMIDARNQYNEVYQNFYEQLTAAGRPNVEADADARIIAARAVTLATSEGKSAADILERWQLRIEDGEQGSAVYLAEREGNGNFEQAMYKSKLDTLENFVDDIFNNPEDTSARYFANLSNSGVNFDIPRDTVLHDKKHSLTAKEWTEVASNIDNIESAALSSKKRFDGQSVLMKVATPNGKYGVVFEHMKSGRNIVTTAFKDTDANIDNWIKNNSARAMQTASTTQKGLLSSRSMSDIISVLDNNVNDTLYQLPQKAYGVDGKADINTPEFKRWFGDSLIVDENGRPLVMYHGTVAEFDVFNVKKQGKNDTGFFGRGFYFTPIERLARYYAYNKIVMPVYLKINNPLDLSDIAYEEIHNIGIERLKELGIYTKEAQRFIDNPVEIERNGKKDLATTTLEHYIAENKLGKKLSDNAKKKGYDGVIVKGKEYVVFEPNQIKSVYNRGSFSRTDDNIYYQTGAEFGWPDYQEIEASEPYIGYKKYAEDVRNMIQDDVKYADLQMSINRVGGISSYISGETKDGEAFRIRISDHDTNYDTADISFYYSGDKNKFIERWQKFLKQPEQRKAKAEQQKAARKEYIAENLPKEYIGYYRQYGLKALKKAVNEGQLPPFKFTFNDEQQKIYGTLGISWRDVENFIKENDKTYYQTGEKAVGRRVYSVFDLKVGDHTAIGDVQEIDNENRTIKINDRIYSMFLLDTQMQYKGLVVNDAPVENAEENVSEAEQVDKIKKAEENRPAVEEQKRNNREYNWKAKDYFGITNNLDVGGYILTDGDVLDLSGRKFGGDGRSRSIDHREISDAFEDYSVSMEDFINSGNIRYMPESNSILMSDVPTAEQYKVIEKIINRADGEIRVKLMNDANNWGSDKDFSREYPAGTTLSKIKRDINAFYQGAGVRDIMQFLQTGESRPQEVRGSFTRRPDTGEAIIKLFQTADASTVVHELGHFFLDDMRRFADNPETAAQLQAIYRYVGSKDGNLTREQHEYFADSFEAYLLEGRSPNALLKKVFRRFKSWLRNLWSEVKRLDYVKLNDEIRKTFDDMLGGRKIDFAMQQSAANMESRLQRGFISNWDINKAMELLHEGKISKAEMQSLIDRMKNNEVGAKDFKQKLKDFVASQNINKEKLSEYDYNFYRRQLENLVFDREKVRSRIGRLLNWTKPRTQNGKLVGRFPDKNLNDAFDHFRELVAMDKDAAREQQQENAKLIEEFMREGGDIDVEKLIFENKLLGLATGKISDRALLEVYEGLSDSYNAGRLSAMVTGEIRKERKARLIAEAEDVLTGGGRINWRDEKRSWKEKAWKALEAAERGQLSWGGLMDLLSRNDKSSTSGNSKLSRNMDVFNAEQKMYAGIVADGDNISEKLMNALKGSANKAISVSRYMDKELDKKTMIEWVGNENIGKRGLPVKPVLMRKEFSKDQLIDIYMKAQDEDTREIMAADPINQYNEEFLRRVNEELTEDDIAVAKALFEFYNENYERFNQFYEEHFGISLPHNKFYSPRSMTRNGVNIDDGTPRAYASFSGAKQRVAQAGSATINFRGAFAALHKYVQDLNHYMGFADALQDINAVFGDKKIKAIIDNVFGAKMNRRIRYEIENFANNGKKEDVWNALAKVRARYAKSVLGLKPALAIKQITSFPAYWENIPTTDFIAGLADFFLHPKQAMEILGNTTLMKSRDVNIIRDFEVMSQSEMFKNMKKARGKFKWNDFLMANIKLGDRFTIYSGGWALYKSELKKNLKAGMSEAEAKAKALETFERVTDETQQSGRLSQQSYMQSNAMWRAFTMFLSAPNQYLRKEIKAVNAMFSGRMSKKQIAKTLFIYHVLLPMFFQFVADGFRWDDDSQLKAVALGSLNGYFLLGKVIENAINGRARMSVRDLVPFWGSLEDFQNMVLKFADEDLDAEDVLKAVKTLGELTGLPLKYVQDVINNFGDYAKAGEPGKEVMLWLGWSPYALRDFEEEK
nr:MAG TPA: crystallin beta/gamma motif-containing protein [Bacteriophage sp.]